MALADTLAVSDFLDQFEVEEVKFRPQWNQERSLTGAGETLYADRAPMLWLADVTSIPMEHADAEGIMALINSRYGGIRTALLYNPRLPFPSSDPDGSIFGSATPTIATITDQAHVSFSGFPADYVIPRGTYFSVLFDTSRYYLGQFAEARTAAGTGAVASVEVTPPLPAAVTGGDAVTIKKPAAKFRITPNSAYPSQINSLHSRITFEAEQTYAK